MTPTQEIELFARLARNEPALREWFKDQLNKAVEILIVNPDEPRLRIAQGQAQLARSALDLLEKAPNLV